ncbi:unnamed protein product [Urochloa humidicola]
MAEAEITTLVSKFGELATQEAKVLLQVGEDIVHLRNKLEWLQAYICDADRDRRRCGGTDGLTSVLVRQTRQVTFDAEDAVDRFFLKVQSKLLIPFCSSIYFYVLFGVNQEKDLHG